MESFSPVSIDFYGDIVCDDVVIKNADEENQKRFWKKPKFVLEKLKKIKIWFVFWKIGKVKLQQKVDKSKFFNIYYNIWRFIAFKLCQMLITYNLYEAFKL